MVKGEGGGGGRGGGREARGNVSSLPPHTVYMFTQIRSAFSLLSLPFLPPPLLSQNYGKTALHFAASGGNPRIVEILIKADPSAGHLDMKVG